MGENTFRFDGHNYIVFTIKTQFGTYNVIVVPSQYTCGGLALSVISVEKIGEENGRCYYEIGDIFGVLTVNVTLGTEPEKHQFVKNYSENEGWAEELAKMIGGKKTDTIARTGFCDVPLYDFSEMKVYAD